MAGISELVSQSEQSEQSEQSDMSRTNRLIRRNVHIYHYDKPTDVLGGFCVVQDIRHISFYSMLDVFITPTDTTSLDNGGYYYMQTSSGVKIERDDQLLQPGDYYIVATGELLPNRLVHNLQAR